jgi:hypothetical protein
MFREKFNRIAVRQGIALREVPHGLNQKLLPINVAGIGGAFASLLSGHIGGNWDRKNLRHRASTLESVINISMQFRGGGQ